ncbi:MAG: winged helix-turn-helix transcriptional regulator [Candidatus Kerfeldbacteria bacterium]|nr:winged helix-turn-helix transcriptional regulator [Candidatus Kerfeldbacteria bacterium]
MRNLEKLLKAVANRRRLEILAHLKRTRQATVGDIADAIKLSFKATSKHLGVLANAEVVESEKKSLLVFYRLTPRQHQLARHLINVL